MPEADNPSAVGKALDCAQGVGGLANVRRGLTVGSKLLRWDSVATTQAYKDTTVLMGLFDSRIHDGGNIDKVVAEVKSFSSPDAAFAAKMFYDAVQTSNNIGNLAERVIKKIL